MRVLFAVGSAVGIALGIAAPLAAPLAAQAPSDHAVPSDGTAASDSVVRAAYVRDSSAGLSWVLPPHRDWTRYAHPAECIAAIELLQMRTRHRTDWTSPVVLDDTLSTVARDAGLACAKKFTLANVSPHEWMAFLDLSLRLGKLSLAHDIIANAVRRVSTPDEKASVLTDALMRFDGHTPAQSALVDSLQQQITTLGPQVRWRRLLAAAMTAKSPVFDTARNTQYERDIGSQWRALTRDDRVLTGFVLPQWGENWYATREYARMDPSKTCQMMHDELQGVGNDTLAIPSNTTQAFVNVLESDCKGEVEPIGKVVSPLAGARWFRPGDTVGTDVPYVPIPGHVTLVVTAPVGTGRPSHQLLMYARLAEQFGSRGLDIVLTQQRRGFLWGSGALSVAQETKLIRWYDHDYLKLPFTIGVYDSAATDIPRPMLIGKDGRNILGNVVLNSDFRENEYIITAFIEQAVGAPPTAPSRATSPPSSAQ